MPMVTGDNTLLPADRALLAQLRELTAAEAEMPDDVALAAKAAQGWGNIDAELAALVQEPVLTRGDGTAYSFAVAGREIRVEVEPVGYRRRRLNVVLREAGLDQAGVDVRVQRGDGEELAVATDHFGERSVEVGLGPVRVLAGFAAGPVTTGWFTI